MWPTRSLCRGCLKHDAKSGRDCDQHSCRDASFDEIRHRQHASSRTGELIETIPTPLNRNVFRGYPDMRLEWRMQLALLSIPCLCKW